MDQSKKPPFHPQPTLDDLIREPDRIDTRSWPQLKELAPKIAERAAAVRDIESRILYRFLCDRNPDVQSDGFPRLLNAKQIAELFNIPEPWVREQSRLGHLPSIKLGHYLRFRLDDVKKYLDTIAKQPPHKIDY